MKILLVNDDSIQSIYLKEVAKQLKEMNHEVMVVAPMYEQSAKSHAITLTRFMELKEMPSLVDGVKTYALDGTPADCNEFAYIELKYDYDLVVSGCNNGLNMGDDIIYSGTVAGASEAAFKNKKGMAISVEKGDFEALVNNFKNVFNTVIESGIFKEASVLNINIPRVVKGYKITHQGSNTFDTKYMREGNTYKAYGESMYGKLLNKSTCDLDAYYAGFVSITPITVDRTDYNIYNKFKF
jgi:5'-nucleotidase